MLYKMALVPGSNMQLSRVGQWTWRQLTLSWIGSWKKTARLQDTEKEAGKVCLLDSCSLIALSSLCFFHKHWINSSLQGHSDILLWTESSYFCDDGEMPLQKKILIFLSYIPMLHRITWNYFAIPVFQVQETQLTTKTSPQRGDL